MVESKLHPGLDDRATATKRKDPERYCRIARPLERIFRYLEVVVVARRGGVCGVAVRQNSKTVRIPGRFGLEKALVVFHDVDGLSDPTADAIRSAIQDEDVKFTRLLFDDGPCGKCGTPDVLDSVAGQSSEGDVNTAVAVVWRPVGFYPSLRKGDRPPPPGEVGPAFCIPKKALEGLDRKILVIQGMEDLVPAVVIDDIDLLRLAPL